ncbi:MAG: glutaredoxin family protein [Tepidisphaeraceae bacterium]
MTLLTKPGCSLCDDAQDVIVQVRARIAFDLEIRNILDDLVIYANYRHDIPVVLVDGREVARHRLTVQQLEVALPAPLD